MKKIVKHVRFEDKTIEYIDKETGEKGRTTPKTWKLMKDGYVVLKDFIPKEIIDFCMDGWKTVEYDPKKYEVILERENDIIHESPKDSLFKSDGGWNTPWGVALHKWVWNKLKGHIDMNLQMTYSYSRKYERGAYLKAHADRPSCEISATLCLDYMSDDNRPWPIWVDNSSDWVNKPYEIYDNTQAIPIRERRKESKSFLLEPGDLLLYQGPNVAHWREYFIGKYSYHIFLHFYNDNGMIAQTPGVQDMIDKHFPDKGHEDFGRYIRAGWNPCRYDGCETIYHPIDPNKWHRKLYDEYMDERWHNDRFWAFNKKSDYVNVYDHLEEIKKK